MGDSGDRSVGISCGADATRGITCRFGGGSRPACLSATSLASLLSRERCAISVRALLCCCWRTARKRGGRQACGSVILPEPSWMAGAEAMSIGARAKRTHEMRASEKNETETDRAVHKFDKSLCRHITIMGHMGHAQPRVTLRRPRCASTAALAAIRLSSSCHHATDRASH